MFLVIKAPKDRIFWESPHTGTRFPLPDSEIAVNVSAVRYIKLEQKTLRFEDVAIHFTDEKKAREVYDNIFNNPPKIEVSAGVEEVQFYTNK